MYKPLSFILVLLAFLACNEANTKQDKISEDLGKTTYYLIRHAEKDRSNPSNKNPKLTQEGLKRAQNWARYFEKVAIDQVFSTNYMRTMQTAAPTASQKRLTVQSYHQDSLYDAGFKQATMGSSTLVVGHSDTTPRFVNAVIGADTYTDIDDKQNGLLYVITLGKGTKNVEVIEVH